MPLKRFHKVNSIFVIFPPGCGGNHLSNLLSFLPNVSGRFSSNTYFHDMVLKYHKLSQGADIVAHFSDLENLQKEQLDMHLDRILKSEDKYVFCAHADEYIYTMQMYKKLFANKKKMYFLMSEPTLKNEVVFWRRRGYWMQPDTLERYYDLYNPKGFLRNVSDPKSIIPINTDLFYTIDGFDYLQSVLKENINHMLPSICKELHTIYIRNKTEFIQSQKVDRKTES